MIKYAKVKDYQNLGEVGFMSHIYQWVNTKEETPSVIIVWRDSANQKYWVGKIFLKTRSYINEFEKEIDLSDLGNFGLERIEDLQEFIKGHEHEVQFKEFKLCANGGADNE